MDRRAVATFLKLPEAVSLGVVLDKQQFNAYHHGTFMTQADTDGFIALIMTMVREMAGGETIVSVFTVCYPALNLLIRQTA